MGSDILRSVVVEALHPGVKLVNQGVIAPGNGPVNFMFQAVNLDTVDIEVFQIYEDNILQFLQQDKLSSTDVSSFVGEIVYRKKHDIKTGSVNNKYQQIGLNLSDLIITEPNAIYQVRVGYRPSYVRYACSDAIDGYIAPGENQSIMRYRYYNYDDRNSPCKAGYYTPDKFISSNILISDVGAILKKGYDGKYYVSITSLSEGTALSAADVSFYNLQRRLLASVRTDVKGYGEIEIKEKPNFAVVRHTSGVSYLRIYDAEANSVTDFDTGGKKDKALDAFLYSDRGVYRPGDTIFMHAIVEDELGTLPLNHPVTLTVKDARGQERFSRTTLEHVDHVFSFKIATSSSDATGRWTAVLQIGSNRYSKAISVETVKPNRLRLGLDVSDRIEYAIKDKRKINISSSWLHGAPASNLKSKIDAKWTSVTPYYKEYKEYDFLDPARRIVNSNVTLYDGQLNSKGEASFHLELDDENRFPGMLRANVTSRVIEKGGDFSENYTTLEVSPYATYVGLSLPKSSWGSSYLKLGEPSYLDVVVLDSDGRPQSNRDLSIGIYDISWNWWYRRGDSNRIYNLNSDSHSKAVKKIEASTGADGKVKVDYNTDDLTRGRKLIRVCDKASGHCAGSYIYASGWGYSVSTEERNSLSKLQLSSDKTAYEVGDRATITIPSQEGAKLLISIEDGLGVRDLKWIEAKGLSTTYTLDITSDMAPNVYLHVSLVQAYDQVSNDLPMRMYGILPIKVSDPETDLQPVLSHTAEFAPESSFDISVSEQDGRDMTYTIAIVDEGLLDLTNFQTPNPHAFFYAKQSHGVKTWDVYDDVLYGLKNGADKIVSVGGDGEEGADNGQKKAIRFKPVVFSAGPFKLEKGDKKTHSFTMPNYIGSVRAMVVARSDRAYGHEQTTVPVKSPLMLLPTVPRVVSQGEQIRIPVSVFAMEDDISDVSISINTTDNMKVASQVQKLSFEKQGEQVTYFDVKVGDIVGIAKIDITATSGRYSASQQIELDIRNPNPRITEAYEFVVEANQNWSEVLKKVGVSGSNEAVLELSHLPQLDLSNRLGYLVRYPYGCLEQTTSKAFPQLYLAEFSDLIQQERLDRYVNSGINRITSMQGSNGAFRYWPGSRSHINEWSTSYAGHFLIEAKAKGYYVSTQVLHNWADYQKSKAQQFRLNADDKNYKPLVNRQAYRLYTLAMYGEPDLSAMNNLRSERKLTSLAKYLLAAAYAKSSKKSIALSIIEGEGYDIEPYQELGYTYGSDIRDMSLIAQCLSELDRKNEALVIIKRIIDKLNNKRWHSTQTLAFALTTIGKFSSAMDAQPIKALLAIGPDKQDVVYDKSVFAVSYDPDEIDDQEISITNKSDKVLFGAVRMTGQKSMEEALGEAAVNRHVKISVDYTDMKGNRIDIDRLPSGTDFRANVKVTNLNTRGTYLDEMALTQIVPSGWEIRSGRLNQVGVEQSQYDYQDVRDDRVHTFFDLGRQTKTYTLILNATYEGDYFLPPVKVEAMYDGSVIATTAPRKVSVVKPSTL